MPVKTEHVVQVAKKIWETLCVNENEKICDLSGKLITLIQENRGCFSGCSECVETASTFKDVDKENAMSALTRTGNTGCALMNIFCGKLLSSLHSIGEWGRCITLEQLNRLKYLLYVQLDEDYSKEEFLCELYGTLFLLNEPEKLTHPDNCYLCDELELPELCDAITYTWKNLLYTVDIRADKLQVEQFALFACFSDLSSAAERWSLAEVIEEFYYLIP